MSESTSAPPAGSESTDQPAIQPAVAAGEPP